MQTRAQIYEVNREKLITNVASLFAWDLPDTCSPIKLERDLISFGSAAIFWEEEYEKFINTQITGCSGLNLYGYPKAYQCIGIGYHRKMPADLIAWGLNSNTAPLGAALNYFPGIKPLRIIEYYANQLTDIDIAIQNNINNLKCPGLLLVDDPKLVKTAKEAQRQAEAGEWVVVGSKAAFSGIEAKEFRYDASSHIEEFQNAKRNIYNEFLSTFGIPTLEHEKNERMIVDEATANNDSISLMLESMLSERQKMCKRFKKLYGFDIYVEPKFIKGRKNY